MSVVEHLEKHLGIIDEGWKSPDSAPGLNIVCFREKPFTGINTFSTLGLSKHDLALPDDKVIKQEIVFFTDKTFETEKIVSFMTGLAEQMIATHKGLYRGECILNDKPIFTGSRISSMFCSVPMIVSEDFCLTNDTPPTMFVWLVPLYAEEADHLKEIGVGDFETLLEEKNPDLWDLNRPNLL